jgi:hypothetical protein
VETEEVEFSGAGARLSATITLARPGFSVAWHCADWRLGPSDRDNDGFALAIPTAPDWRVSPDLHVLPGTTRWAVTAAGKS